MLGRSLRSLCSCLPLLGTFALIQPSQALDLRTSDLGSKDIRPESLNLSSPFSTETQDPLAEFENLLSGDKTELLLGVTQGAWQRTIQTQVSFAPLTLRKPAPTLSAFASFDRLSRPSEPTFKVVDRRVRTDSLADLVTQATTSVVTSLAIDTPFAMGGSLEQTTTEVEPQFAEGETTQLSQRVAFVNSPAASTSTPTLGPVPFGRASERQRPPTPALVSVQQTPARPALPQPTIASRPQTTTVTAPTPAAIQPIAPPVPVKVARSIVAPPLPSNLDLPPLPNADRFLPSLTTNFIWPARGVLTSGFGPRWGRMHRGIDIAAPIGTPIYAAAAGVVTYSQWNSGGFGNLVEIRHADGTLTLYAHNHRNLVHVGQYVQQGQQIAEMGSTGRSTGPHVHFEVHPQGRGAVNPIIFLQRSQG
ncbi:MAG TPA: peptidoglycan DD-metalloendopeptidase family protein [Thermosynechococcus sp. M98_K2018_005]|nr:MULTISPECIES: M23 family metallopeptidase [unclassified Thermosynechococcus]HIK34323.1 peptidoglycan DD-metalloendopeptidase family protein [Thermosynechococcus sp. M98_K2018_005]HIK48001.1 peptidoglycan DD-metalloendopeptidase family protein [Thermosynechococcus sp. M55_K2018_012]